MTNREQCGDYEIYQNEHGWWVVEKSDDGTVIGKFLKKEDALENIANFLQDDSERTESESVC